MACCMLGLLLVYQCIDAAARVRAQLREGRAGARRALLWLGAPAGRAQRLMLVATLAFTAGFASTATVAHAEHLARDAHAVGRVASDWCRTLLPARFVASEGDTP